MSVWFREEIQEMLRRGDNSVIAERRAMPEHSIRLPEVTCPRCRSIIAARDGEIKAATKYLECLRRCDKCGIGFSNATSSPTLIYLYPEHNVPEQVRGGIRESLEQSLNEQHRADKISKFGFSTSEDALTWTVFHYLDSSGQLRAALHSCAATGAKSDPSALLLWGAPSPPDSPEGIRLRCRLIAICDRLGEDETCRSEPDVAVDLGDAGVVLIEVKYRSGNNRKKFGDRYNRYIHGTDAFSDVAAVGRSELYELVRNWRIGVELARGRPFTLVNLVIKDTDPPRTEEFRAGLNPRCGRFLAIRWHDFTAAFQQPDWLKSYLAAKL
jgi:hypothetical protein